MRTNTLSIGSKITVDDELLTIVDRAPGGPGLMWATDNRGGYFKVKPKTATRPAKIVEGPMTAGGKLLPEGVKND